MSWALRTFNSGLLYSKEYQFKKTLAKTKEDGLSLSKPESSNAKKRFNVFICSLLANTHSFYAILSKVITNYYPSEFRFC